MTHDARAVANSLLKKRFVEGARFFTPLQVNKLVYFCHGWMLGLHKKPLIREYVEAWAYGPVVPIVYRALKNFGGEPISDPIAGVPEADFDEFEDDLVKQVCEKYGRLSGIRLSALTHAPGTPWEQVWKPQSRNLVIPNELIQRHYAEKAEAARSKRETR